MMLEIFSGIIKESFDLLGRMAPFLLFGFFFAGLLHVFIKTEKISRHLGQDSFKSVVKASLFGAPLPLCSCGVIPAALSLRKEGASRGAVLSFLISTPTTGVDSIFATYSLLGPFFTVYRLVASLVTGIFSGALANIFLKNDAFIKQPVETDCDKCAVKGKQERQGFPGSIRRMFKYAYFDLIKDSGPSLIFGILLGGAISYLLPENIIESQLGYGIFPMIIMLLVGLPMYVCATSSIPIAASLMMKGLAPGAAFVFLLAGPATNVVTMSVVVKSMGRKALAIYLFSIVVAGLSMGSLLNFFWERLAFQGVMSHFHHGGDIFPAWLSSFFSILLLALIFRDVLYRSVSFFKKFKHNPMESKNG